MAKFSSVLERIAVDAMGHQMKQLLACLQEPCCNKNEPSLSALHPHSAKRDTHRAEVTVPNSHLSSPATVSPPAHNSTVHFRFPYLSPKDSGRANADLCFRKLYKAHSSKIKSPGLVCHLYACFMWPTSTLMQHPYLMSYSCHAYIM